jgi:hypothetical protein
MEQENRKPGYYPDPKGEADERYFDGANWTKSTRKEQAKQKENRKPGYYPDPKGEADERYFDGANWTTSTRSETDVIVGELKKIRYLLIVFFVWLVVIPFFVWAAASSS